MRGPVARASYRWLLQVRSLQTGGVHSAQLFLQIGDLVAEPGGQLELQVTSGRHHLRGEVLDQVGQLGTRHAGGVAALEDTGADRPAGLTLGPTSARRVAPRAADRDGLSVVGLAVDL